jgi:hypothetical protein
MENKTSKKEVLIKKLKFNCEHCGRNIYRKNKSRHYARCKEKIKKEIQKELEEKNKILKDQLEEEKMKRLEYEQKNREMEIKNKEMEEEKNKILIKFNEHLLKIFEEKSKPQIVNVQNNNNNNINVEQLTIRYVRKNFTDAFNYEDLMKPLMNDNEIKLIEESPIGGCYELLKRRCIDDVDIEKRPIHLVDKSRKKYK